MKKLLLSLIVCLTVIQFLPAQYCGNSGMGQCTSPGQLTIPGFGAPYMQAAPLINGTVSNTVIEFLNYDTVTFGGQNLTVDSLVFDTIRNLPGGLCWSTNKSNNSFVNREDGCIKLTGNICAAPGQYHLYFYVTINIGFPINVSMASAGAHYFLRVVNSGETVPAVDTTGLAAGTIPDFIPYGPPANCQVGPPTVSLGANQTVCNNSVLILDPVITGGTAPFTYAWQYTGNALSCNTCSNPGATITQNSTYNLAITDANNYTAVAHVTYSVSGTNNLVSLTSSNSNISCSNPTDLTTLTVTNGTPPFTLNWGDGSTVTDTASLNPVHTYLAAGVYPVAVTDANGCASAISDTVLNTGVIVSLNNSVRPACWGMTTGSVQIAATGGTLPYTYIWSNAATGNPVTGVAAGDYAVTVSDATGCSTIFNYYLSPVSDPWGYYTYLNSTNANCANNGTVTATVYGGVAPFVYSWSNGSTSQNLTALSYGTYSITISDSVGCQTTGVAYVNSNCSSYITGVAFVDSNNNCIFDTGEQPYRNLYITAVSSTGDYFYGNSDNNGHYVIAVTDTGTYLLSADTYSGFGFGCGNLTFCNNSSRTVFVPVLGDTLNNSNIGFTGATGYNLGIHPGWTSANPGFTKQYWAFYYNWSAVPLNGQATITFVYDSNLVYQYSDEGPAPVNNTATHTLTWTIDSVIGSNYGWTPVNAYFQVPQTLSLSYLLQSDFTITPTSGDCDPSDNHYHYSEVVTGSHDPNEKTVSPAGPVTEADSVLTYTIHFQNTGTDSTHFVIIKDTLSPNLDPATVRNIASSDKYSSFTVSGKGILTWTFNPLRIVDSITNPTASKRFIMFTVKKKANLPIGTTVSNKASIYFDYNPAVVTNTVTDTASWPLYIFEVSNNADISVKAFPNPFSDVTHIVVNGLNEKFGFELYDVTGRLQQSIPSIDNSQFDVRKGTLSKGVYLYRIIVTGKPGAFGKLVVE